MLAFTQLEDEAGGGGKHCVTMCHVFIGQPEVLMLIVHCRGHKTFAVLENAL